MRIGYIAMSGVRVVDEELQRLGMTLPGFVERGRTVAALPSLGLLTLAGMTPPQHQAVYREVDELILDDLEPFDLLAVSTLTARAADAYALADRYRALGVPVVMGGLHVSTMPEEASAHCDALVVGEGEPSWPRVIADAERGALLPIYRNARGHDLADAPMPAFHLLDPSRYNRLAVQTSRGCPLRCDFCGSSVLLTPRYKQKPVEKVLAEVDRLCAIWERPFVELADDNSFVDRRYWRRLLPQLGERQVRWFTETDISVGDDAELLELMHRAGCVEVLIGLESPSVAGLAGIELKTDWKRKRLPRYREAVRAIQSQGIAVNGCFVLGLDGQGPEVFSEILSFVEELELFDVQITLLTPFPGTPVYERLRREGRLLEQRPWRRCTLFDLTFRPALMSPDELRKGFLRLGEELYGEAATRRRRQAFKRCYLRSLQTNVEA